MALNRYTEAGLRTRRTNADQLAVRVFKVVWYTVDQARQLTEHSELFWTQAEALRKVREQQGNAQLSRVYHTATMIDVTAWDRAGLKERRAMLAEKSLVRAAAQFQERATPDEIDALERQLLRTAGNTPDPREEQASAAEMRAYGKN